VARSHDRSSGLLAAASGIDPLSDVLRTLRLTGSFFFVVDARSPWAVTVPEGRSIAPVIGPQAQDVISYHLVLKGSCWAGLASDASVRVQGGEIIVIPHGDPYVMATSPGRHEHAPLSIALDFFREQSGLRLLNTVREGGDGPDELNLVCGFLACDALPFNPVLSALPRLVHLPAARAPEDGRLNTLVEFALAESRENLAGSDCVLLRLSELLFVEVVRRYVATLPEEQAGWLAGLRDPVVGRALGLLHGQPGRRWDLATLSHEVGASRSSLSERFTSLLGEPAMQYLTRWRMQVAARLLSDDAAKVSAVASDVGYDSEAAFSRAFKKVAGVSPAEWRSRQRSHVQMR
jgi:AraC-like DNA-binding protein